MAGEDSISTAAASALRAGAHFGRFGASVTWLGSAAATAAGGGAAGGATSILRAGAHFCRTRAAETGVGTAAGLVTGVVWMGLDVLAGAACVLRTGTHFWRFGAFTTGGAAGTDVTAAGGLAGWRDPTTSGAGASGADAVISAVLSTRTCTAGTGVTASFWAPAMLAQSNSATSITAMGRSLFAELCSMLLQKGQPTARILSAAPGASVFSTSRKRFSEIFSEPGSSSFQNCAPPAPQQNDFSRVRSSSRTSLLRDAGEDFVGRRRRRCDDRGNRDRGMSAPCHLREAR